VDEIPQGTDLKVAPPLLYPPPPRLSMNNRYKSAMQVMVKRAVLTEDNQEVSSKCITAIRKRSFTRTQMAYTWILFGRVLIYIIYCLVLCTLSALGGYTIFRALLASFIYACLMVVLTHVLGND